jgi:pSer/pThr/pTyr-binding forkhead associated (FHA) protein
VSEALLTVLKLLLLLLLYLFFFRVLRAVWVEVRSPIPAADSARAQRKRRKEARTQKKADRQRTAHGAASAGPQLVIVEPPDGRGHVFDIDGEITLGRAGGCGIVVDDTFVSQLHARLFQREGRVMVEDLGSTNGTYLNRQRVAGQMVMQRGDRLQVGNTVLELR